MAITYPGIDDSMLIPFRALASLIRRNPDMLLASECPYGPATKEFLTKYFAGRGGEAREEPLKNHYSEDDLESEISELYSTLKRAGLTVTGADPKDKIALLKTSSDLLTKLVSLRERLFNVKSMSNFQATVIKILETLLTPGQRTEFLERLAAHVQVTRTSLLGEGSLGDPASAEGEGPGA